MRVKGASIQQILLGMALLAAVCWNLAHAGELRGLQLATGPTGTRAELRMDRETGFQLISLAGPDRLVVDFPGSRLRPGLQLPEPSGLVPVSAYDDGVAAVVQGFGPDVGWRLLAEATYAVSAGLPR